MISLLLASAMAFNPAPKTLPKDPPSVADHCQYGVITQAGRAVTIAGGDSWVARGKVRDDAKIEITWTCLPTGRDAIAVYSLVDGSMAGKWAWIEDADLDGAGALVGENIRDERIPISRD